MVLDLGEHLSAAYMRAQIKGDHNGARQALAAALTADPALREAAVAELRRLREVVKARSSGGRSGCYVTELTSRLLGQALGEPT